jgi:hypothetical protein
MMFNTPYMKDDIHNVMRMLSPTSSLIKPQTQVIEQSTAHKILDALIEHAVFSSR